MDSETFNAILKEQLDICESMLGIKAKEYATHDRLHNFKIAAQLQNQTAAQALGGMMAKHTVSIYDMIESGAVYPEEQWTEKITDHINYLILLKAIVADGGEIKEKD